jgi:hypothetical protein
MLGIEFESDLSLIDSLLELGDRIVDAVGKVIDGLVAEWHEPLIPQSNLAVRGNTQEREARSPWQNNTFQHREPASNPPNAMTLHHDCTPAAGSRFDDN